MEDQALREHVIGCLARDELQAGRNLGARSEEKALVDSVVQRIKWLKEQWGEVEELLRHREQEREAFG